MLVPCTFAKLIAIVLKQSFILIAYPYAINIKDRKRTVPDVQSSHKIPTFVQLCKQRVSDKTCI